MDLYHYFMSKNDRSMIKNVHYFPIYERHFRRFVGHPVTMFEIGTGRGGSCLMWKYFFGPMARIVTIDIADNKFVEEAQIFPRRGSQSDPAFLNQLLDEFGPPDIVFDDGSHMMDDINASFDVLAPGMSPKGTYLVEDLDGAYWPERGGGLRSPRSFIERCKTLVDEMNSVFTRGELKAGPCGMNVWGVSFYQSVIVVEKTPFLNRDMLQVPLPS